MRINKLSWHYRFWRWSFSKGRVPSSTNLCRYFLRVIVLLTGYALRIASVCLLAFWLIYSAMHGNWEPIKIFLVVVGGFAGLFVAIGLVIAIEDWLEKRRQQQREPGLIRSYLRAKKQKVCPFIEFVEPESRR